MVTFGRTLLRSHTHTPILKHVLEDLKLLPNIHVWYAESVAQWMK